MRTQLVGLSLVLLLAAASVGRAQDKRRNEESGPPGQPKNSVAPESSEVQAIRAVDEAFVREYNRADTKALGARFAENAEVVEVDSARYQGRTRIEQRLAETFASSPGVRLEIVADSVQLLSPDVAKTEGRTRITAAEGAPEDRRHTVLYVKRDGKWLISSVREEPDPLVRPHDRLKDLEWLIGEWVDESPDSVVRVDCRWSEDENFILRTFHLRAHGKPLMTVSQRIGWDPAHRQIRSWEFDSQGGFGEGTWSRDGDRWRIKHKGTQPEGASASATNIMVRERRDLVRWVSTDRVVGGESIPDGPAYVMVRVPPSPASAPNAPTSSSHTSKTTRSSQ